MPSVKSPPSQSTPGDALQQLFMRPLGLSAYRLSTDLGVPPIAVSQILRGKRAISPAMALRLGTYFGVEPAFWMALQAAHDLRIAAQAATGADGDKSSKHPVARCPALEGRALVIRETKTDGTRQWEVLLVNANLPSRARRNEGKESPKPAPPNSHPAEQRTAKGVTAGIRQSQGPAKR